MSDEQQTGTEIERMTRDAQEEIRAASRPAPTPTSAREWRKAARRRWLLRLPSGATVKIRLVDLSALMMGGVVTAEDAALLSDTTRETMPQRVQLGQRIATYAVVDPVVVLDPDDDEEHMPCSDLGAGDAIAMLAWALMGDSNPTLATRLTVIDE